VRLPENPPLAVTAPVTLRGLATAMDAAPLLSRVFAFTPAKVPEAMAGVSMAVSVPSSVMSDMEAGVVYVDAFPLILERNTLG